MNTINLRTAQLFHLYGPSFLVYANALARANHLVISYAAAVAQFTLGPAPVAPRSGAAETPLDATAGAAPIFAEPALAVVSREAFEPAPFGEPAEPGLGEGEPARQTLPAEPGEIPLEGTSPLASADEGTKRISASSSKRDAQRNRRRKK